MLQRSEWQGVGRAVSQVSHQLRVLREQDVLLARFANKLPTDVSGPMLALWLRFTAAGL